MEARELAVLKNAIEDQRTTIINSTGVTNSELDSKLISFAYELKNVLAASKKDIKNYDPQSIKEAFKNSIDTGIAVDTRKLAYLVPYGNQIQYQVGYKGLIHRIQEINPTAQAKAEIVYKGDIFTVEKSDGQAKYVHKVANPFAPAKDMQGVYAYIEFLIEGKRYSFIETMNNAELAKIKGKAKTKYVWEEWGSEMAKKAVLRRLCKTLFVGDRRWEALEEVENKNYTLEERPKPINIDYSATVEMPPEQKVNPADIPTTPEEPQVVREPVDDEEEDIPFGEDEQETPEESLEGDIRIISVVREQEGTNKNGKPYILYTLAFEDGTAVRTFDRKEYAEGQKVRLVNVKNNTAEKVEIL